MIIYDYYLEELYNDLVIGKIKKTYIQEIFRNFILKETLK